MSIRNARRFFEENLRRHIDPVRDPYSHNLNAGLVQLAESLAAELDHVRQELAYVSEQVAALNDRLDSLAPSELPPE